MGLGYDRLFGDRPLRFIADKGPVMTREIAMAINSTNEAARRILRGYEKDGLVVGKPGPSDRCGLSLHWTITEVGKEKLNGKPRSAA